MSDQRMSLSRARELIQRGALHDQWEPYEAARTIVAAGEVLDKVRAEYASLHQNSRPNISAHTDGYLLALDVVEQWLAAALSPEAPPHGGASSVKE